MMNLKESSRANQKRKINLWIVAKFNFNEFNILLKELEKKIGRKIKFYRPKMLISNLPQKYKYILSDYAFFYNENFINTNFIRQLKNTKRFKIFFRFLSKRSKFDSRFY